MRFSLLLAIAILILPIRLNAQRCDGMLRFALLDATGDTVRFTAGSIRGDAPRITSSDGRFAITAEVTTRRTGRAGSVELRARAEAAYVAMRYGCAGTCRLVIVRAAQGTAAADTMALRLENMEDAHFGAVVRYRPGSYGGLVCDTTKHDVVLDARGEVASFHYRSLGEQYPTFLFGGYDVTGGVGRTTGISSGEGR